MSCSSQPSSISNGYFIGSKSSYSNGDEVYYFCDENYSISGGRTVTCSSGSWSGGYPSCSFAFLTNAYFIVITILLGILLILLIAVLGVLCRKHCCKRKKQNHNDGEGIESGQHGEDGDQINVVDKSNQINNKAPANHQRPTWDSRTKPSTKGMNGRTKPVNTNKKKTAINPNNQDDTYIMQDSGNPQSRGSDASVRKVTVGGWAY